MDVRFLLLLVCLCTISFPSPVLALQRDASTLDNPAAESGRQRSSHGSLSQEESKQEGLITVHHGERLHMQSSTNDMSVRARRLLSHGRQVLAIKAQDDKEQPKNKVHKEGSSANTQPLGDTGHETSTDNEMKSGDKETVRAGVPHSPPDDVRPAVGKETEGPSAGKPNDQVKDNRDKKPNAPAIHCESHCEVPKKLVKACLRIPGDGVHKFSLFITNEEDSVVSVKVVAPEYLTADPSEVSVSKGKSETIQFLMNSKFEPSMLDLEAVKNQNITVSTVYGECKIAVPLQYLRSSGLKQKPPFSSYLPSITPRVVAYLLALVLVVALVGAWLCYKCCGKKRSGDAKYQQLEMIVPGQSTPKERVKQSTGAWDEVWDDDWEDTEAAKSSSRLSPNLSSRGLGSRRGNKDGWDSSWED